MPESSQTTMVGNGLFFVRKLSEAQPLAFRVLRRIKVFCPLRKKHGCQWEGDYGDLQTHLLSKSAHLNQSQTEVHTGSSNLSASSFDSDDSNDNSSDDDISCCYYEKPKKIKVAKIDKDHEKNSANMCSANITEAERVKKAESDKVSLAESFKEEANAKFSLRNYSESRALYKKALSILMHDHNNVGLQLQVDSFNKEERKIAATLHANIAATFMMTREYAQCVENCSVAIEFDKTYTKAYVRKSKALIALGQFSELCTLLKDLLVENDSSDTLSNEMKIKIKSEYVEARQLYDLYSQGEQQLKKKDYISAKSTFGLLVKRSNASNVIINAARADLGLGLTDSSLRLSLQVLRSDPTCSEGYEVRGLTMQLMGDFDSSSQLFKEGLRLNPDCERIKVMLKTCRRVHENVKKARSAVFQRRFEEGVQSITAAIGLQTELLLPMKAPLYSTLLTERAECFLRLKQFQNSLSDASKAVYSLDDCVPAWIIMANALHGLNRHEEALSQMEDLLSRFGQNDTRVQRAYEKADFEVRKLKRPDFYALFGVSSLASEMELKKAYKQKAKEFHPDRLSSKNYTAEQRKEAEKKFKILGEGLEILCDDFKRQLYDEGYDQEAIRERVAAAQHAAHRQGGAGRQYHHH